MHYARWQRHGDPLARDHRLGRAGRCAVATCGAVHYAKGFCRNHYRRFVRHGDPLGGTPQNRDAPATCTIEDCEGRHVAKGFCEKHYGRWRKHGDPLATTMGEQGKGTVGKDGYRVLYRPDHPNANVRGYVFEHRVVMSGVLGRPLFPDETVHHRNGVRDDNRPDNLELWTSRHPKGQSVKEVVAWAREILERYEGTPPAA